MRLAMPFAYPSSMTWEQVVAAMQQLAEDEDAGTEERATEEKEDVEDVEEKKDILKIIVRASVLIPRYSSHLVKVIVFQGKAYLQQ